MEINESLILSKTSSGELSPSLTSQEAKIVLSSTGTKIKDLKKGDVANKVTQLITASLVIINHSNKMSAEDRKIMEQVIVADLFEKFGSFTLKEVENAFWLGSRGQLKNKPDEVIYMSIAIVYQWLTNYKIIVKREAMKKQIDFEAKKEVEKEEIKIKRAEVIILEDLKASYSEWEASGNVYDPLNVLYDNLDKRGLIRLSNKRKKEIYDQAFKEFKSRHETGNTIGEYMANKKVLAEIEQGSSNIQAKVKVLAKQKALKIVYQDIKESGLSFNEFLNEGGNNA